MPAQNIPHVNAILHSAHCSPFTANFWIIHLFVWDTEVELEDTANSIIMRK